MDEPPVQGRVASQWLTVCGIPHKIRVHITSKGAINMANRREFLMSIAAASAATAPGQAFAAASVSSGPSVPALAGSRAALAINGGKPVRETTLFGGGCGIGCEYYDEEERAR